MVKLQPTDSLSETVNGRCSQHILHNRTVQSHYVIRMLSRVHSWKSFLVRINKMESLPFELVEKILAYLTYHDCRRVLTVSKRWNMVVKGLLPPKIVNITGQRKNKSFGGKCKSVVGEYNLYSSYKGNPVYISNCTRNIPTGIHRQHWKEKVGCTYSKWKKYGMKRAKNNFLPDMIAGGGTLGRM